MTSAIGMVWNLTACSASVASPAVAGVEQALTSVVELDFEDNPVGPLAAPWSITPTGASTIAIANSADHGHVLELRAGKTASDSLLADFGFSASEPRIHFEFDVEPVADASFIFDLRGAGPSYSARRIRFQRSPGSSHLTAKTGSTSFDCGELRPDVWSSIALDVTTDLDPHTFSVTLNGAATPCQGQSALGSPFTGVLLMDASNEGIGGVVRFDNISATGASARTCSPSSAPETTVLSANFDSDPLGALRSPWTTSQSSDRTSTATVVATSDHGRALQLRGGTASGQFGSASRGFSATESQVRLDFAVKPSAGSAFFFELGGAGSSIGARRIRLQRGPGSNTLVATTAGSSNLECGSLPSGAWTSIGVAVQAHLSRHSFDLFLNGAPSACTNRTAEIGPPFNSVGATDASNEGWGGSVLFDDFVVRSSSVVCE